MMEIKQTQYSDKTYTDVNALYKYGLIEPDVLSKNLTYLYGRSDKSFPLLTLTEGQGLVTKKKPMKDTQYTWPVIGRPKHTSRCIGLVTATATPGKGHVPFQVDFEDNNIIGQFTVLTPDAGYQVRAQGEPVKMAANRYRYTMVLVGSDDTQSIAMGNFAQGKSWVMLAPMVAGTLSRGNRSGNYAPGEMTNQYGYQRFSKNIAGNIANKVANVTFDIEGGTTDLWMPWEMHQFELDRRLYLEHMLWDGKYNRDANGNITTIDEETNEPMPSGAGVKEILNTVGNYVTYGNLNIKLLDQIFDRIWTNTDNNNPAEVVMYTGTGGFRQFNEAITAATTNGSGYFEALGMEQISKVAGGLQYGEYFTAYKHISGATFKVVASTMFDKGLIAEMQRDNGELINGLPRYSYSFAFLDHSALDNGERNIQLVCEEGREYIQNIKKGMSPLPSVWKAMGEGNMIATDRDESSYHVMTSMGVNIMKPTTSFFLERV